MAQTPRADPGYDCPLWHKPMEEVCHKCPLWIKIVGKNHNTGADMDQWGCSISFLPLLLIENAQQTRGAAAATEDARNKIVETVQGAAVALVQLAHAGQQVQARNPEPRLISHQ